VQTAVKKTDFWAQIFFKKLTGTQIKLFNALMSVAREEGDKVHYTTTFSELKKMASIKTTENISLKENLIAIASTVVEYSLFLESGKPYSVARTCLLAEVVGESGTGRITFSFPPTLKKQIIDQDNSYFVDIATIAKLRSSYSIVLYELLRDYAKSPALPILTIEDIRELFGISPTQYVKFYDFKRYVLDVAVDEVNECTELKCSYRLFRRGRSRSYTHIQLSLAHPNSSEVMKEIKDLLMLVPQEYRESPRLKMILADDSGSFEKKLSCLRYTNMNAKKNYEAYLVRTFKNDWGAIVREEDIKLAARHGRELQKALKRFSGLFTDVPDQLCWPLLLDALRSFPLVLSEKLITENLIVDVAHNIWKDLQKTEV
jgi:hypothetical protein